MFPVVFIFFIEALRGFDFSKLYIFCLIGNIQNRKIFSVTIFFQPFLPVCLKLCVNVVGVVENKYILYKRDAKFRLVDAATKFSVLFYYIYFFFETLLLAKQILTLLILCAAKLHRLTKRSDNFNHSSLLGELSPVFLLFSVPHK